MYTLFHSPYSQHARRVVSLMIEAGLEYQLRNVAMEKGEHLSPAYLANDPNHQVPSGDAAAVERGALAAAAFRVETKGEPEETF